MKKIVLFICLIFCITLFGCSNIEINTPQINYPISPPVNQLPNDDADNDVFDQEEEDEKKKKNYLVSSVDTLRIRSLPNTNSTIVGYLDKNDALPYNGIENGYYKTIYKENTAYVNANYCTIMQIKSENEQIESVIDLACTLMGYPYIWGSQRYHWGNGKLNANYVHGEYDCSAFVQYVYYKSNKVVLDVTSRAQSLNGTEINLNQLCRGDLIFFTNESRKNKIGIERIGHVGIYFGNNYILHTASDHAVIEPISSTRWSYYITARKVI